MRNSKKITKNFNDLKDFLVALGDEKRQSIIVFLMREDSCKGKQVSDLIKVTNLSRPAISHHLKILKQAGLVDVRSEGTKNFYYLSKDSTNLNKLISLLETITKTIEEIEEDHG